MSSASNWTGLRAHARFCPEYLVLGESQGSCLECGLENVGGVLLWGWRPPVVTYVLNEIVYLGWEVILCHKLCFNIGQRRCSMNAYWWGDPRPKLSWQELLVWSCVPPDTCVAPPSENICCCPDLLKTGNHFLSLFFIPFVSE